MVGLVWHGGVRMSRQAPLANPPFVLYNEFHGGICVTEGFHTRPRSCPLQFSSFVPRNSINMAKINDLVKQVGDARLRRELEAAVAELKNQTRFGLIYESHLPEAAALPGFPIHEGASVVRREQLSARHAFRVCAIADGIATLEPLTDGPEQHAPVTELVALQRFGEPIYPGLGKVGSVERGGAERPHHVFINGENYHVLKALTWTHRGKVDAIYIDPPYNTGAKDWKYNNDYVEGDDLYRHSKWLAMMERRLRLARELLNPADSVLIVTIDEKEYLRLGLLLEKVFPEAIIQMVSSVINPSGAKRDDIFSRTDEYIFFVTLGAAKVTHPSGDGIQQGVRWWYLRRTDVTSKRGTKKGGTSQFYPIYVDKSTSRIVRLGKALRPEDELSQVPVAESAVAVFPIREDGLHMNWGLTAPSLQRLLDQGLVRVTPGHEQQPYIFTYISESSINKIADGTWVINGERPDGSKIIDSAEGKVTRATTQWQISSHDAGQYGTQTLRAMLGDRRFPFPKSLYAVEDALRFFVANKPDAVILDFFAGSGTTAHAVMRLNKQDSGRRQCISVTNNEVSADEQRALREQGLCPGDAGWERWGIFDYITKPRIEVAINGKTPDGQLIQGDYKFTDEFPMADGFDENATFFHFDYLDPDRVDTGQQYDAIVPLMWLASGAIGPSETERDRARRGYSLPPGARYGVLFRESRLSPFLTALAERPDVTHVWIVTNRDDAYAQMRATLPTRLQVGRLYRDYLRSFRLTEPTGTEGAA